MTLCITILKLQFAQEALFWFNAALKQMQSIQWREPSWVQNFQKIRTCITSNLFMFVTYFFFLFSWYITKKRHKLTLTDIINNYVIVWSEFTLKKKIWMHTKKKKKKKKKKERKNSCCNYADTKITVMLPAQSTSFAFYKESRSMHFTGDKSKRQFNHTSGQWTGRISP